LKLKLNQDSENISDVRAVLELKLILTFRVWLLKLILYCLRLKLN